MHLKENAKRGVLGKTEPVPSKEEREVESLLSPYEWLEVFMKTCTGLWKLGPAYHHRLTYFVYCAASSKKIGKDLQKVSPTFGRTQLCDWLALFLCFWLQTFIFFCVSLTYILKDYGTTFMLLKEYCHIVS